jgi:DNA/RNA-binding domain of Phe-tRNA-synthetase-like protein
LGIAKKSKTSDKSEKLHSFFRPSLLDFILKILITDSLKEDLGMMLKIDSSLAVLFPDLKALVYEVRGVHIEKRIPEFEAFKNEVIRHVRERYNLESLKDLPTFRFYRDFFWRIGVDPTKNCPAAEALIRRILGGGSIPNIDTLVDSYNLASIETEIALAAFDAGKVKGDLLMRPSGISEKFEGIGMDKLMTLQGGEIVVSDLEKLIAVYPYRDAENTKVTEATEDILLMICGTPGIENELLFKAGKVAIEYLTRFCDGTTNI